MAQIKTARGQIVEIDDADLPKVSGVPGVTVIRRGSVFGSPKGSPPSPAAAKNEASRGALEDPAALRARAETQLVTFVNANGAEYPISRWALSQPGALDALEQAGWREKHGMVESFARSALGSSLLGGGEEVVSQPSMRRAGGFNPPDPEQGKIVEAGLVRARQDSARDHPLAAMAGSATGATLGSPIPGGKALVAGKGAFDTFLRLGALGTATSGVSGALSAEGSLSDRLKAGGEAALYGAPVSFAAAPFLAPWAKKLPASVDALDDPNFGLLNPNIARDPRVLRNQASIARLSSTRATPKAMYDVTEKAGFRGPNESPAESIVRFGDNLNSLTSVEPEAAKSLWQRFWTMGKPQPVLDKNSTAPRLERSIGQEMKKSGELIGAAEEAATRRGASVDLREYFPKVGNIGGKLDASRPPKPLTPTLMEEVSRKVAPPTESVLPFPGKMVTKQTVGTKPTGLKEYGVSDPKPVQAPGVPMEGEYAPLSGFERGTVTTPGGPVRGASPRLVEGPSPSTDRPFAQRVSDYQGRAVSLRAGQPEPPLRSALNHPEAAWEDKSPVNIEQTIEARGASGQVPPVGRQASYPSTPITRSTEPQPWWNTPRQEFVREPVEAGPAVRPAYVDTVVRDRPPMTEVQPYTLTPSEAKDAVQRLRSVANEDRSSFSRTGVNRVSGDYPAAIDESAGVLAGMNNTAVNATLDPYELAAVEAARRNYQLTSTANDITNSMKQTTQAPYTIGAEIQGSVAQNVAASAGFGPAGQVGFARLARAFSRVRNHNPAKASRYYGLARGLEGDPLTRGGQIAAGVVRGAERMPYALEKGQGVLGGDDLTEDTNNLSVRRQIARILANGK